MKVRPGDKVVCTRCNAAGECVGTVHDLSNWYGQTVVTVYFDNPRWDQCDREVFYISDLEPNPLTKFIEVQTQSIGYH